MGRKIIFIFLLALVSSAQNIRSLEDNCSNVYCISQAYCENGKCIPFGASLNQIKQDFCLPACKSYEFCEKGKCVDNCKKLYCHSQAYCKKGKCIPNQGSCGAINCEVGQQCQNGICIEKDVDKCNNSCQSYEFCSNGICQDKCAFIRCANCVKGQCGVIAKPECTRDYQCRFGNYCNAGKCVSKCSVIKCMSGYECKFGYCFPLFKGSV